MIEPRELAHSDDALQAALVKALEENAMLRRALEERSLAPDTRRLLGRTIAGLILLVGVLAVGLFATQRRAARAHDEGIYAPAPVAVPAPPAPPAAPAPVAPVATPRP